MTGCELVAVVALTFTRTATHAQPVKKVCLAALIRRARREGAVVIDMRDSGYAPPPGSYSRRWQSWR